MLALLMLNTPRGGSPSLSTALSPRESGTRAIGHVIEDWTKIKVDKSEHHVTWPEPSSWSVPARVSVGVALTCRFILGASRSGPVARAVTVPGSVIQRGSGSVPTGMLTDLRS